MPARPERAGAWLGLLAAACAGTAPTPRLGDVSADDCTASVLVYDAPPPADSGTAFLNDGCWGERVFLGIDGQRRELRRAEDLPLGTGGPYSDGVYRVTVTRGDLARRQVAARPPDAACPEPTDTEFEAAYAARVEIRGPRGRWTINGTLRQGECGAESEP